MIFSLLCLRRLLSRIEGWHPDIRLLGFFSKLFIQILASLTSYTKWEHLFEWFLVGQTAGARSPLPMGTILHEDTAAHYGYITSDFWSSDSIHTGIDLGNFCWMITSRTGLRTPHRIRTYDMHIRMPCD